MKNLITHPMFGEIRAKMIKKEPWFVAKDVCKVLDIEWKRGLTGRYTLDEDEVSKSFFNTNGGKQEMSVVNESGLYTLIFQSRKPNAKKFRKWVTSEVLPMIRKFGFYSTDEHLVSRAELREERKAVKEMLSELNNRISLTDEKAILKQTRVSEWHLSRVLRGEIEDVSLVSLIYARVTANRGLHDAFYSKRGVEKIINQLRN